MRIEQCIEVIGASGQYFACKKIGHLKKSCPTRCIKDPTNETLEGRDIIGHQKPPPPQHDKVVMEWRVVGKSHVLRKTPQSQNPPSPLSSNQFDLLQELPPMDEHSSSSFLSPKERPNVTPTTEEKVLA